MHGIKLLFFKVNFARIHSATVVLCRRCSATTLTPEPVAVLGTELDRAQLLIACVPTCKWRSSGPTATSSVHWTGDELQSSCADTRTDTCGSIACVHVSRLR